MRLLFTRRCFSLRTSGLRVCCNYRVVFFPSDSLKKKNLAFLRVHTHTQRRTPVLFTMAVNIISARSCSSWNFRFGKRTRYVIIYIRARQPVEKAANCARIEAPKR